MHDRPEMQLEAVTVEMEVVQYYVVAQHEHMVMDEEFKDLMTERFLGSV